MNPIYKTRLLAKTIGLLGAGAFVALTSMPGLAQMNGGSAGSSMNQTEESVTPNNEESPADSSGAAPTEPNTGNRGISRSDRTNGSSEGPSIAPGEGRPGPSETPSSSPSVPGTSEVDDPGSEGSSGVRNGSSVERDALNDSGTMRNGNVGPSAVPGETVPGASETPSGSPSVPGTSTFDDPNEEQSRPSVERDALNTPDSRQDSGDEIGPSVVPGELRPGASETPSGSPSVPGTSGVDDPGELR